MPPPKAVEVEKPDTLDIWRKGVDADMTEGKRLVASIEATTKGMLTAQKETQTDVRELRQQMRDHERLNAERAVAREESEREMRGEISALRESTAKGFKETDSRLDGLTELVKVLVDRQPQTPPVEAVPPPSPITSALGLAPRHPARTGSTAAVAGGGVSLAAVLGILVQLGGLPVAVQWVLGVLAVMVGVTACVVVGVRMVRRD